MYAACHYVVMDMNVIRHAGRYLGMIIGLLFFFFFARPNDIIITWQKTKFSLSQSLSLSLTRAR